MTLRLARRAEDLKTEGSAGWALAQEARSRVLAGRDVIVLTIGDVDMATDAAVIETAVESLRSERTHYSNIRGEETFRQALIDYYTPLLGRRPGMDEVSVFPGTQSALFCAMTVLAEVGDEVLLMEPHYASYEGVVAATGASVVKANLAGPNGLSFDLDRIAAALSPRTRVVLLNSPNNPCGVMASAEQTQALADLCAERGVWLISDEVYGRMRFDGAAPLCAAAFDRGRGGIVVVDSLSKSHAMTGWRIGWSLAPPLVTAGMDLVAQVSLFGSPPFIQDAAIKALADGGAVSGALQARYSRRSRLVVEALAACPALKPFSPQAGMFVFMDVSATGLDGGAYAWRLLDEAGVAVVPGAAFGVGVRGWVRLSLTQPEDRLVEACRRILAFTEALTVPATA